MSGGETGAEMTTRIADILEGGMDGTHVALRGWVHRTRESGKLVFLVVRDASGTIQATVKKGHLPDDQFEVVKRALMESSLELNGVVKPDPRAPGGYEVLVTHAKVHSSAGVFPIKEQQSPELLLDHRHLWVRAQDLTRIWKLKHQLLKAMREWFDENKFTEVTPTVITTNAAEGGSTVFEFDYFGQKAFLSQTAQMYLEAMIFSLENVYSITPSFRAEKSRTTRHLTEYMHLEAEEAWTDTHGNMKVQEELLAHTLHRLAERVPTLLRDLGRDPAQLENVQTPFRRMTYTKAVEVLQSKGAQIRWGEDLGTNEERVLTAEETQPIFVTNFPKEIKAFYMKIDPDDPRTVLGNDCLAPEGFGEIIGASQREENIETMVERLKAHGAHLPNYEWYLDLRRYGSVPHSGFGLGVERVLRWITKQEHIRDMTPFPRTINRAYP